MCLWAALPGAAQAASSTDRLADASVRVAAELFRENRKSVPATNILDFALTVRPEHEQGLLLQAKIARKLPLGPPEKQDLIPPYTRMLLQIAEKTRSDPHKLVLYKLVEQVDPANEKALVEVFKAKNAGTDTSFEAVLAAVDPRATESPDAVDSGTGAAPPTPVATPVISPPTGPVTPPHTMPHTSPGGRIDPTANLARKLSPDRIRSDMERAVLHDFHFYSRSPLTVINRINDVVFSRGYVVVPKAPVFRVSSSSYYNDRVPHYYGSSSVNVESFSQRYPELTVAQCISLLCSFHGTSYDLKEGAIELVPSDDAEKSMLFLTADELAQAFADNLLEARRKYKDRMVILTGKLAGSGRGIGRVVLYMAGRKVELRYPPGTEIDLDDYRDRDYSYVYDSYGYQRRAGNTYRWKHVTVTGRCAGYGFNAVILDNCTKPVAR